MPAQLRNGVQGAPGGRRPGAGRKPDEFKQWIKKVVHSKKARARFEKIVEDAEDAETLVTPQGVEVPVRAKADTYLRALEMGWHYDKGKPVDRIQHTTIDQDGNASPVVVFLAPQTKGEAGQVEG